MESGCPDVLGASIVDGGTNFAVWSAAAEAVELCLFDETGRETHYLLPEQTNGVWHGYLRGCKAGQAYGYRVHGKFDPERGLRANPAKLLIDPYARALAGTLQWSPVLFDHRRVDGDVVIDTRDSAPFVPKSTVTADVPSASSGPRLPWAETLVYEANVRGYTMRRPGIPDADRGTFAGMRNGDILSYVKALGVTAIEIMPVFEFVDEPFLVEKNLRNFWGYNTIHFFAPASRYSQSNPRAEFIEMVNAIHDAGLEVILDVAYNHTGESGGDGPTLSFRGLDNLTYYRTAAGDPGTYVNDTGTGNTLDMDAPTTRRLVLDSLAYWAETMGVDGFRFDLATVMGRSATGFTSAHPFFAELAADKRLSHCKLIAEPWDPGPGGYQLGAFPPPWAEWNDRYRDSVRRFWRGDGAEAAELAQRLHGSADLFEPSGRGPCSSINFVTAHDGFTLLDLTSYAERHNEDNGEDNRDGHAHNFSDNHGVEGRTDDDDINARRRQQRLNFLATLLLSQGVPMLLAGDEVGNSQRGNNNAYAQDNDVGWVDWSGLDEDPAFLNAVRALVDLRRNVELLRQPHYVHGGSGDSAHDVLWLHPNGDRIGDGDWPHVQAFTMLLMRDAGDGLDAMVALMLNGASEPARFSLPNENDRDWCVRFASAAHEFRPLSSHEWGLPARSLVCASMAAD